MLAGAIERSMGAMTKRTNDLLARAEALVEAADLADDISEANYKVNFASALLLQAVVRELRQLREDAQGT